MVASAVEDVVFGAVWGAAIVGLVCWGLTYWRYGGTGAPAGSELKPEEMELRRARQAAERRNARQGVLAGLALGGVTMPRLNGLDWLAVLTALPTLGVLVGGTVGACALVLSSQNRPRYARRSWVGMVVAVAVGALSGLCLALLYQRNNLGLPGLSWLMVMALGAFVAVGELVSRYKDAPVRALLTLPAFMYLAINAAAAAAALALAPQLGWSVTGSPDKDWPLVVATGLGAMALLRSSVFNVRTGDAKNGGKDVGVGLSGVLDTVLDATDRALDRVRAQERAWFVARVMEQVSFERAAQVMPSYVVELTQNLSPSDRQDYLKAVCDLQSEPLPDHTKLLNFGLLTMNRFGEGVLTAALLSLSNEVKIEKAQQAVAKAAQAESAAIQTKAVLGDLLPLLEEIEGNFVHSNPALSQRISAAVAKGTQALQSAGATATTAAAARTQAEDVEQMERLGAAAPAAAVPETPNGHTTTTP